MEVKDKMQERESIREGRGHAWEMQTAPRSWEKPGWNLLKSLQKKYSPANKHRENQKTKQEDKRDMA